MKTYDVVLTKSYKVTIKAENKIKAKEFSEFYTSDIKDISTLNDMNKYNFEIENIDCKINEALETVEIIEKDFA